MPSSRLTRLALPLLPLLALPGGCAGPGGPGAAAFAPARRALERNCVHCHGTDRLPHMPSLGDTAALDRLRGSWIIPGRPEASRLLQVVTLADDQAGAMPPTGHAITAREIATLRQWIAAGAPLPDGPVLTLQPRGEAPRSW